MPGRQPPTLSPVRAAALLAVLLAALGWIYWPTFTNLVSRWSSDPQYTHGYVVPLFALLVLWFRRDRFPGEAVAPSWWGVPLLFAAGLMRLAGSTFSFEWLEAGSFLPALAGVVLLATGPAVLRWAWPVAAFLIFVLPWPWQFDQLLTYPLRRIATVFSTYLLQTAGLPALARGNVIVINDLEVGVVEACSGLGMLMTFFALSTAVALIMPRPTFERGLIFLSAIPVGILMNVLRITVTVLLYQLVDAETARLVFHDVAGWVMMPLALAVMWLEMQFLAALWVPEEPSRPLPLPMPASPLASESASLPAWVKPPVRERQSRPSPSGAPAKRSYQETRDVAP